MTPVSLTYDDLIRLIRVSVVVAFLAAVGILAWRWEELQTSPTRVLIQSAFAGIGAPPLLVLALSKLAWTREWLAWLLGRRMVHGLWWGELRSDFQPDGASETMPPIPIAFVIKQTYFFLSIQSYTATQPAHSTQESLIVEPKSERARLQYVFEMQRLAFGEDKITFGYGDLRLTGSDTHLEGHYWTSSPTRGSIHLDLVTNKFSKIDSFADAKLVAGERAESDAATERSGRDGAEA